MVERWETLEKLLKHFNSKIYGQFLISVNECYTFNLTKCITRKNNYDDKLNWVLVEHFLKERIKFFSSTRKKFVIEVRTTFFTKAPQVEEINDNFLVSIEKIYSTEKYFR